MGVLGALAFEDPGGHHKYLKVDLGTIRTKMARILNIRIIIF